MASRGKQTEIASHYQRRMADETDVKNLFFGLALSNLILSPVVVLYGGFLWLFGFIRTRAVNHRDETGIRGTLLATNPLIELLSVIIAFHSIANVVNNLYPAASIPGKVFVYSAIGLIVFAIITVFEHVFGEYLEWWSERAADQETAGSEGFWTYISVICSNYSLRERSPKERRQGRSRQRDNPHSFVSHAELPTPQWSWAKTIIRWLLRPGRLLAVVIGLLVFSVEGFGFPMALALTLLVFVSSSVLTDQIKYLYFYWPYRDGHAVEHDPNILRHRILMLLRHYSVSTILGIGIVKLVF